MKRNILILIIVVLIIIAGGVYYWYQPKTAGTAPTAEVKAVLEKLQKHIILPTDEKPEIGQIDNPVQAAKVQPFVTGAQKGDLLIVYVKARKAIVYSPSRDLIVNVGPISVNPEASAGSNSTNPATSTPAKTSTKK